MAQNYPQATNVPQPPARGPRPGVPAPGAPIPSPPQPPRLPPGASQANIPAMPKVGPPQMPSPPGRSGAGLPPLRAPQQSASELLPGAPAAVRAAADQVLAAHAARGGAVNKVEPPSRSLPPEELSDVHMIALRKGSVIGGRYKVEFMIGRGGMGTVYGVTHVNTEEKLALKLLHPALAENQAAVERFRTEAKAPVKIDSEHVVRVVDADISHELDGVPYIVMERLKGHDLRSELKRRGALPAGEVVLFLKQVARALDKAHKQGIVHRDLKPANMYIVKREDGSPLVKVLDFGIAKLTDDAAKELTVAGQVFGTPWYMAPEQARGDLGRVGPATDLWAIGLIAYQLLTGRNYWTADGMAALVGQICYEPMLPPTHTAPHLGPLFDMWFGRACHREPAQRFGSAKEMVNELAQALGVNQSTGLSTGSGHHPNHAMGATGPQHGAPGLQSVPGMMAQSQGPGAAQSMSGGGPVHMMEATAAPLYSTASPKTKSGAWTAVVLGVVIALVIGGTGMGVWMVSSASEPEAVDKTADSVANATPPPPPEPEKPAETAKPQEEPPAAPSAAPSASASASAAPSADPAPKTPGPSPRGKVRQPPPEQPKTTPKAAPKVGEIDF